MEKLEKIGAQVFTVRDFMNTEDDIKRTFERLKKLGYDEIQTAGHPTDGDISYEAYGKLARDAGLDIIGTHDIYEKFRDEFPRALEEHKALGLADNIMGIGGWWADTVEEYEQLVVDLNKMAADAEKAGYRFSYHQHNHEFIRLPDGRIPYDMIIDNTSPNLVFTLDTYWAHHGGCDVRHLIEDRLGSRLAIVHLKDMAIKRVNDMPTPYYTEVGQGNMWWEGLIESCQKVGCKHYIVELDNCPGDPFESLRISSEFLHSRFF